MVDEGLQGRGALAAAVVARGHALLQLERRVRVDVLGVLCKQTQTDPLHCTACLSDCFPAVTTAERGRDEARRGFR